MALRSTKHWFGIALDAPHARTLAQFYADLLGWQIFGEGEHWVNVAPSRDAGYNLSFATEPHYQRPTWPSESGEQQMQMHLDFEVDNLEQAVAHAINCGATLAHFQPQDHVRVLLDPAGHPFCLYLDQG